MMSQPQGDPNMELTRALAEGLGPPPALPASLQAVARRAELVDALDGPMVTGRNIYELGFQMASRLRHIAEGSRGLILDLQDPMERINVVLRLWSGCISGAKVIAHETRSGPNTVEYRRAIMPQIEAIADRDPIYAAGLEAAPVFKLFRDQTYSLEGVPESTRVRRHAYPTFWARTGPTVEFRGLTQGHSPHCVYASLAGAINHVVGSVVWTVDTLVEECKRRRCPSPTFDVVMPVAAEPVKERLEYEIARERLKPQPMPVFVAELSRWVQGGGVAVISLEAADNPLPSGQRLQNYHMLTLIAKDGDRFQAWDTNGLAGFVTEAELATGFVYKRLECYPVPWLIEHPDHDCVLFRKPPMKA
jgi:hypothetical protein